MRQRALFLTVTALWASCAFGQDWAKAKLEKSSRHGEYVQLKHGDRTLQAWVVYPEVSHKATSVVVIHEIFGLTDWARLAADELAEAGYIAIAPDLVGPHPDENVMQAIRKLPPAAGAGRPGRGSRLHQSAAGRQRQSGRRRLLLGRREVVRLRHAPQGPGRRLCFLRDSPLRKSDE